MDKKKSIYSHPDEYEKVKRTEQFNQPKYFLQARQDIKLISAISEKN
jgi:hypothetical protein